MGRRIFYFQMEQGLESFQTAELGRLIQMEHMRILIGNDIECYIN